MSIDPWNLPLLAWAIAAARRDTGLLRTGGTAHKESNSASKGLTFAPPCITTATYHQNIKTDKCIVLLLGIIPVLK
jgi:hypothetical protein